MRLHSDARRKATRDGGFTLVEMLVAILITGIIVTVLFSSFEVFYTNGAYTSARDDHSAGAEVVAAYLDRDLASATGETLAAGTACNGSATNTLTVTWRDYVAGALPDDSPVPGTTHTATYAVVSDDDPQDPGRCMIQRTYDSGAPNVLMRNLAAADFAATASAACGTAAGQPIQALKVTVTQYGTDDPSGTYVYRGCLNARTNGLTS